MEKWIFFHHSFSLPKLSIEDMRRYEDWASFVSIHAQNVLLVKNLAQPDSQLARAANTWGVEKVSSSFLVFTLRVLLSLLSHLGVGIVYARCAVLVIDKILANFIFFYLCHFYKIFNFFSWAVTRITNVDSCGGIRTNYVEQVIGKICSQFTRILGRFKEPIRRA